MAVAVDLLLVHASLGRYDRNWRRYNERFRAKFADRLASPDRRSASASAAIHCRVESIEQAKLLRAAFLHFGYGR